MKKYKKLFIIGIISLTFIASFFIIRKAINEVDASIPSGYTADETYDEISLSDMTFNGLSNQMVIRTNQDTDFIYTMNDSEGSLIFKFKYDVVNDSASDSNAFRVHFDVADDHWDSTDSVWFRGDGTYLSKYSSSTSSFGWNKKTALTKGMHEIEFGRIALYKNGSLTGDYYIYYKVDGVEKDSLVNPYDLSKMNGSMFINFSASNTTNKLYDISYVSGYEAPDKISVSDLKQDGCSIGKEIYLNTQHSYSYDAYAEHKSVVFNFLYEVTAINSNPSVDELSCQIHFSNTWIGTSGGVFWLRDDKNRISKTGSGYTEGNAFKKIGIYEVELGKLYITEGTNTGKYYLYIKVDGELITEYTIDSMPDKANIFTTGTDKNHMYDMKYMPVELTSDLYLFKWDVSNSGMEFSAKLRKDLVDRNNIKDFGFIVAPYDSPSETTVVIGKLIENGSNYYVKTAITALNNENIIRKYTAKFYYVLTSNSGAKKTYYTDSIVTSFYDELDDLSKLSNENQAILNSIKAKVLNVTIDEDDCAVTGATKTGNFDSQSIVLTGSNSKYEAYYLNGDIVNNNDEIWIGYHPYKVTLSNNSITLTKTTKKVMYGGSEHFVTLNPGHDENMTAEALSPMCVELGLGSIRLDIYFENLFSLSSNNELTLNTAYYQKLKDVINELKTNGGITDFLAVFWVMQPYGFKTWTGAPWSSRVAPDPTTQSDYYLKWLQINGEAARLSAELFPEILNYEAWNEPEIMGGVDCPLCKSDGTDYSASEKARILTDLMYYYTAGIRKGNPKAILTTSSLCCAQNTGDARFPVTTVKFLELMYQHIKDNTPVPGCELDKEANNYFEVINCHPYLILGVTTSNWTTFMNNLHNVCAANDDAGTPIYVTEFGFAQNRTSNCESNFINVLQQATTCPYVTKFYFYKVHDYTSKIDDDRWGLYNYDGTIKEIGKTVKNYINPTSK